MRTLGAVCLTALLLQASAAAPSGTSGRLAVASMEQLADKALVAREDPFELLGNTRGAYLEGYGAVFSTEVSLAFTPAASPFRGPLTKPEITAVNDRKRLRLPALRKTMQGFLLNASASLDGVGPKEQVVYFVNLYYHNWEDRKGLPSQIVMRAEKQKLLEVQSGRAGRGELASIVKVTEL
jgi:hypothetical protein